MLSKPYPMTTDKKIFVLLLFKRLYLIQFTPQNQRFIAELIDFYHKAMQLPTPTLSLTLLILTLTSLISKTSSFLSISQNRKYINSGSVKIDVAYAVSWNPYVVNVTYSPTAFTSPVEGIFLTINDMSTDNSVGSLSFYGVVNSSTQTNFILNVYSNTSAKIKSLGYRYLVIAMRDGNTFGWILRTVIQSVSINMPAYTYCSYFTASIPLGAYYSLGFMIANQYAISFLGYDIYTAQANYFSFACKINEGLKTNVNSLTAQITVCNDYYWTAMNINTIHFNVLIHNRSEDWRNSYIRSQYFYLTYQGQQVNTGAFSYSGYSYYSYPYLNVNYDRIQKPNYYGIMYGPATLFSINYTKFTGNFQFSLTVNDYSSNLTTSNNNQYFGISVTYFYTLYCPFITPYLLGDNTCYDACPNGSTVNQTALTCSNTTNTTNTTNTIYIQPSVGFQIGSVLGFLCFFLILIGVILGVYLFKQTQKENRQDQQLPQHIKYKEQQSLQTINEPISNNQPVKLLSEGESGIWKQKSTDFVGKCSLCQHQEPYLKTSCNHCFHVKCILEWNKKYNKCPNCPEILSDKLNRVLCRFCRMRDKSMNFSELKKKLQENKIIEDLMCPGCLMKVF